MKNISEWIDTIIEDLVDPEKKLSDTLLKVQVLAFKIDNQALKNWTNSELNGYIGKEKPEYRRIPTAVLGNVAQDTGFNIDRMTKYPLPVEYLDKNLRDVLMTIRLDSKVSELEKMLSDRGSYRHNLPHMIYCEFNNLIKPWVVESAWQKVSNLSIEGVLSTIKPTLLSFLLELNKEFGNSNNISIMNKKNKIDGIYNKTIGSITGEYINISIGSENMQNVNYGNENKINNASGTTIRQSITVDIELKKEITDLIMMIKSSLENFGLNNEQKEDVKNEVVRIETQLKRESPKSSIIKDAIGTIHEILIGVAGNAFTPVILEKLPALLEKI